MLAKYYWQGMENKAVFISGIISVPGFVVCPFFDFLS